MKKPIALFIITALTLTLTACGAKYSDNASIGSYENASRAPSAPITAGGVYETPEAEIMYNYVGQDLSELNGETSELSAVDVRKIIKNASLDLEAQDASKLYASLSDYCNVLGGYEFSSNTQNHENFSVISATLKIPPENLDLFLKFAGENGKVINSRVESDDVTAEYYDLTIRLDTKKRSLESYYKLLENARTSDEIIKVQRTIDQITEEIEATEGRLRVLNNLVDMATIKMNIRQDNDPIKIKKEINWNALTFSDMGYLIKSGFVGVLNVIVTFLQWVAIIIFSTAPLWLIIGFIVFMIIRSSKKKRAKAQAAIKRETPVKNEASDNSKKE